MSSAPPQIIDCDEYGHVFLDPTLLIGDGLDLRVDTDVDGIDAFSVDFLKGRIRLRASSLVGLIPLNEHVILRVHPRVPIANLTRMVEITGHQAQKLKAFRSYPGSGNAPDWVMNLYIETLIEQVDEVLNRGLLRNYEERHGEGSQPHGRIDFSRTVRRFASRGVAHKASYQWFERTPDNPPNRCLKAALVAVHRRLTDPDGRQGGRGMISRVAVLLAAFDQVSDDPRREFLADTGVRDVTALPSNRSYYRGPLDIAQMILRQRGLGFDEEGDDARLPSLLIETNRLFETFVRVSLQNFADAARWPVQVFDGMKDGKIPLYERPEVLPKPMEATDTVLFQQDKPSHASADLVFRLPDGKVVLAGEVKNTAKRGVLPERTEVNQAVTYAVRYGLDRTLLVRPLLHGTPGLSYCGRIGGVDVFDYKVNLGVEDLDAEVDRFALAISTLLPTAAVTPI